MVDQALWCISTGFNMVWGYDFRLPWGRIDPYWVSKNKRNWGVRYCLLPCKMPQTFVAWFGWTHRNGVFVSCGRGKLKGLLKMSFFVLNTLTLEYSCVVLSRPQIIKIGQPIGIDTGPNVKCLLFSELSGSVRPRNTVFYRTFVCFVRSYHDLLCTHTLRLHACRKLVQKS